MLPLVALVVAVAVLIVKVAGSTYQVVAVVTLAGFLDKASLLLSLFPYYTQGLRHTIFIGSRPSRIVQDTLS